MKFHILSDVHNEFLRGREIVPPHPWKGQIPGTDADVVVLAGDIDTGIQGITWAIDESERLDKDIIYVAGNHEFYRYEYYSLKEEIAGKAGDTHVHFLDCCVWQRDGVRVLGLTLWTDYRADKEIPQETAMHYAGESLSDHHVIRINSSGEDRRFLPDDALLLHQKERRWLEEQLKIPHQGKTVVVSHHAPHPVCIHPHFPHSSIGTAFYSNLEDIIVNYDIDLWIYGHTHSNMDTVVHGTRIISNQPGYPGENVKNFNLGLLIEI